MGILRKTIMAGATILASHSIAGCTDAEIQSFTASPEMIIEGDFAELEWKAANAENCKIMADPEGTEDPVDVEGSAWVSPAATTFYTISCESNDVGEDDEQTILVQVIPAADAALNFEGTPTTVASGETVLLAWDVMFPDLCEITPGNLNAPPPVGYTTVNPTATTIYTLTCWMDRDPANLRRTANVIVLVEP